MYPNKQFIFLISPFRTSQCIIPIVSYVMYISVRYLSRLCYFSSHWQFPWYKDNLQIYRHHVYQTFYHLYLRLHAHQKHFPLPRVSAMLRCHTCQKHTYRLATAVHMLWVHPAHTNCWLPEALFLLYLRLCTIRIWRPLQSVRGRWSGGVADRLYVWWLLHPWAGSRSLHRKKVPIDHSIL